MRNNEPVTPLEIMTEAVRKAIRGNFEEGQETSPHTTEKETHTETE